MKVAIVGAGRMGRWFTGFFLEEKIKVIVSDVNKEKLDKIEEDFGVATTDNVNAVKDADRVLVSVPIESFEDVLKEIHSFLRPNQIIMDVCSIKELPVKLMHDYLKTGITLGTHPVFGPGAKSIKKQRIILTPTNPKEKKVAEDFKNWLEERGAYVSITSPRRHDELMSMVLGLPHFVGIILCDTLVDYANFKETRGMAGSTYKMLLTLAEAVAFEDPEFYADLQTRLPNVEKLESMLYQKTGEWLNIIRKKDKLEFATRMKSVVTKLKNINPNYTDSYELMHKLFDNVVL